MLPEQEVIGHPRDVVADDPVRRLALRQPGMLLGHAVRMLDKKAEKRVERADRTVAILDNRRMGIDA